ncbi:hypothetical protein [Actinomycetospora termitidis]|uniref:Uncharacterized protein n=1 Tax=Actinomycetospora termitidis TaxID=3053470 RepID=A0ABT7MKR2_9PSEU|nr:hypothetical protein [Actinomycetospora sp. Odt1-22]MDL5160502.1 hypothetical protein [Actinomycetospora sp. Odt1-22]
MRLLDLLRRPSPETCQPTPTAAREDPDQAGVPVAFAQRPEIVAALERLAAVERVEDERLRGERAERDARHAAQAAADELRWRVAAQRREHGDDTALQARWAGRDDQHAAAECAELDRQVREDREDAEAARRFHEQEAPILEALGREEAELEARAAVPDDLQRDEHEHEREQDEVEEDTPF